MSPAAAVSKKFRVRQKLNFAGFEQRLGSGKIIHLEHDGRLTAFFQGNAVTILYIDLVR